MLIVNFVRAWRAYRRASRRAFELSAYAAEEALELERLFAQLNEHGFQLEHTAAEIGPKVDQILLFLRQPLMAAALPWFLRRILGRPYRRR
ncbi:MAG TPA: hypothetical protein VIT43_06765 [Candidatus Dormibacteraeota bacterium]